MLIRVTNLMSLIDSCFATMIQYQSQEADNTFITSDGTSLYNSTRKWAVKRHYREDSN